MSILDWFAKREGLRKQNEKLNIPGNLWIKCLACNEILFIKDLEANHKVCTHCGHHFRLCPEERIGYFFDAGSFQETAPHIAPKDFLNFTDTAPYADRIKKAQAKTQHNEAMLTGQATLKGSPVNVGVMKHQKYLMTGVSRNPNITSKLS